MGKAIILTKGYNIRIHGEAERVIENVSVRTFAIKPTDFHGISPIPKMSVKVGDNVKAGDPLFYDKANPDIYFTAPVSGELIEIKRGKKRKVTEVVILADNEIEYKEFLKADPGDLSREEIIKILKESGLWMSLVQRPFGVIPNPDDKPKAIFISAFDTAPLAADHDFILDGKDELFQTGINALRRLTDGKVHLTLDDTRNHNSVFKNVDGVEYHYVSGDVKHPAGNVGVHIHHVAPINKGEVVWTISPRDIVVLGRLFKEGIYKPERIVAVAGTEVKRPRYFRTFQGANIENLVKDNIKNPHVRYISGNVLTGRKIDQKGYLGFSDNLISVIEEGDEYEFMGWQFPSYPRPSLSRTFLSGWLEIIGVNNFKYKINTNTHGEHRPYVVTGQYEKVVPMDLYPQQLIKSIMYMDFDEMEGLGIYEVVEEDLALCEFACTSKTEVQKILREGLDAIRIEG